MEGHNDQATLQYEREIRIGMLLLGALAIVFVGVLAQRIWIENRQVVSAVKKPIYLTKAERDELRAKTKPRTLSSLNASTPMRRIQSSAARQAEEAQAESEIAASDIPELSIEETEPEVSQSKPANYVEPEDQSEQGSRSTPPEPAPKRLTPPSKQPSKEVPVPTEESLEVEELPKEAETNDASVPANATAQIEGAALADGDIEAETAKKLDPPSNSKAQTPKRSNPAKIEEAPAEDVTEEAAAVIRKKVEKNPWKRPAAPEQNGNLVQYTVKSGDTLKSIAKDRLGDEARWRELYDLNRGQVGDDVSRLRKGLKLRLPPVEEAAPEPADPNARPAKIETP